MSILFKKGKDIKGKYKKLTEIKSDYYKYIDDAAKRLAHRLSDKYLITQDILKFTEVLYLSAKGEKKYEGKSFSSSYHAPITSDFEFIISRIVSHFLGGGNDGVKVNLRVPRGKSVPDIRIEKNNNTIAIIEIKAKVGWIQTLFSKEMVKKIKESKKKGAKYGNPEKDIIAFQKTIHKYTKEFTIDNKDFYLLTPTLESTHRHRSNSKLSDYISTFCEHANLPKSNLLILSKNLNLNLSNRKIQGYQATDDFEQFLYKLKKKVQGKRFQ